ncbi:MAG TPA: ABC transporter permease [Acidimicrobiales bacterium]|nr:ABC transporter permease [Acidimicrobiales bacterium]
MTALGERRITKVGATLRRNKPVLFAFALLIVLATVGEIHSVQFLGTNHDDELVIDGALVALVALGQTFVILTGGIDLSIPWVLNASAVLLAVWANGSSAKMVWIVPLLIVGGGLIGLLNGIGTAVLPIPPIIMTLGMSGMVEGALLVYTNGNSGPTAPSAATYLAVHVWGSIPTIGVLWVGVLVVATLVLSATAFGRRIYATGLNSRVAAFAGVNVRKVKITAYVVSGASAALAGIALSGYVGSSYLGMGDPYLFESVAAVAIGGASVLGGTGNFVGTTGGALALVVLAALLPIFGLQDNALDIVYGLVILVAVTISSGRVGRRRGGT